MSDFTQTTKAISTDTPLKDPVQKKWLKLGIAILIIIAIFVCVILIVFFSNIFKNAPGSEAQKPLDSISDIQNAFAPPTNTQLNIIPPPPVNLPIPNQTSETNLSANTPPQTIRPTPTLIPVFNYKNQDLGFELKLEGEWQNTPTSDGSIVLINEKNETINIQAYQTSENLSNVKLELSGSNSVNNIEESAFKNFPALSFTANGQKSLAIIANGRLYYIFGSNLINENDFRFINN